MCIKDESLWQTQGHCEFSAYLTKLDSYPKGTLVMINLHEIPCTQSRLMQLAPVRQHQQSRSCHVNAISPSETASAVTQLSRSGTRCPLRGSRCGCSSISHAVAMQFRQQATQTSVGQPQWCCSTSKAVLPYREEPLPQQDHSRRPSETATAVTQSSRSPHHGTHATYHITSSQHQ